MSAGEADETQSAYGDGGGGPGAPTPLSMLDVSRVPRCKVYRNADSYSRASLAYPLET